jgi:hypothetical protein
MIYEEAVPQEDKKEENLSLYGNNFILCHSECMLRPHCNTVPN